MSDSDELGASKVMPTVTLDLPMPPGAAPPRPTQTEGAATDTLIERWFSDHFPDSIVARDTQVWNHVHAAKEDLKRRLNLEPATPDPAATAGAPAQE